MRAANQAWVAWMRAIKAHDPCFKHNRDGVNRIEALWGSGRIARMTRMKVAEGVLTHCAFLRLVEWVVRIIKWQSVIVESRPEAEVEVLAVKLGRRTRGGGETIDRAITEVVTRSIVPVTIMQTVALKITCWGTRWEVQAGR